MHTKKEFALFITDNVAVRKGGCVVVPLQAVLRYSTYSLTMLKSYAERNPSEFPYFLVYHVIEAGQGHMQYGLCWDCGIKSLIHFNSLTPKTCIAFTPVNDIGAPSSRINPLGETEYEWWGAAAILLIQGSAAKHHQNFMVPVIQKIFMISYSVQ